MRLRTTLLLAIAAFVSTHAHAAETSQLPSQQIKIGNSILDIEFAPGQVDLPPASLLKWISNAAYAVAKYYGQFPVRRATLKVNFSGRRSGVFNGTTWGFEDSALTRIAVGQHTTQGELDRDWMLTHELIHMSFPDVPHQHHWIEEGIATYVEPIARAQIGLLTAEEVWVDMARLMPQGEPESYDRGLDHTGTWASTYWGGALFCLVADVRIRERTHNRKGLQDALRGILRAGGNIESDWPVVDAFQAGDAAVGVPVLRELYDQMKATPVQVDLPALWKRLGVRVHGRSVVFDDRAPLAAVRRAITAG